MEAIVAHLCHKGELREIALIETETLLNCPIALLGSDEDITDGGAE
jgi:hypothetical protein